MGGVIGKTPEKLGFEFRTLNLEAGLWTASVLHIFVRGGRDCTVSLLKRSRDMCESRGVDKSHIFTNHTLIFLFLSFMNCIYITL